MRPGSLEFFIVAAMVRPVRVFIMALFIFFVYWETRQISLVATLILIGIIFDAFYYLLQQHYKVLKQLQKGLEISNELRELIEKDISDLDEELSARRGEERHKC